jgi:hypothetical protein
VTEGVKNAENVFVEETSIASITDLNSIFKSGNLALILIKAVDTAHLNSDAGQLGIFTTTTISLIIPKP